MRKLLATLTTLGAMLAGTGVAAAEPVTVQQCAPPNATQLCVVAVEAGPVSAGRWCYKWGGWNQNVTECNVIANGQYVLACSEVTTDDGSWDGSACYVPTSNGYAYCYQVRENGSSPGGTRTASCDAAVHPGIVLAVGSCYGYAGDTREVQCGGIAHTPAGSCMVKLYSGSSQPAPPKCHVPVPVSPPVQPGGSLPAVQPPVAIKVPGVSVPRL